MADESYSAQSHSEHAFQHYGTPHVGATPHSGRYPWGTGEENTGKDPNLKRDDILGQTARLKKAGMKSSTEIANALNMTTTEYRARYSVAFNEEKAANIHKAQRLKEQGWSNTAIGKEMGVPESTIRGWLQPSMQNRKNSINDVADTLRASIPKNGALDIGKYSEIGIGVSADKMKVATQILKDEGYQVKYIYENQLGAGNGKKTTIKVLCAPGVEVSGPEGLYAHRDRVKTLTKNFDDIPVGSSATMKPPVSVDGKRVKVVYAEETWAGAKGVQRDGTIILNPNAVDLRLPPGVHYAQVRIGVDGTHYLKGMAMYGDPKEFPKGVDIMFNTNKHQGTPKGDVLKKMERTKDGTIDIENPFKAAIKLQPDYVNPKTGKKQQGPINIVNMEGDWDTWAKKLPSQMLSKQDPKLAKRQLDMMLDRNRLEYEEIRSLTNPVVKKKLLKEFGDQCDSAAVSLKAAAMPGQKTHVILPVQSLKDNEIFAPNYRDGTPVVLVRFPHGGTFEIPALKVNNRNKEALQFIGNNAKDAVGINSKVAEVLSGADFDGDTVLVIPNKRGEIRTKPPLAGLKGFDPKESYALPKDIKPGDPRLISSHNKQIQMGVVSNLITDMTIKGASDADLERAVRHSMVVIDSEKHKLDYKQSAKDNNIAQLKRKYQGDGSSDKAGASTIISRASAQAHVPERKLRSAKDGGPIDPNTGEYVWVETGATRPVYKKRTIKDPVTGKRTKEYVRDEDGNPIITKYEKVTQKSTRMREAKDARTLSSGYRIEGVYANFANGLKAMGNSARKEYMATPDFKYDPQAKKKYAPEVAKMVAQLNEAKKNAPLERKAQLIANDRVNLIKNEHPEYDDDDLKKVSNRELRRARTIVGISSKRVQITDRDWEAIQARAVSANRLNEILRYADPDRIRELATPRQDKKMPTWSVNRAKSLLAQGLTNQEVADALGVSVSTLSRNL